MKVVTKTATEARNEFFDLIAAAKYGGQVTVVVKNGKKTAQIAPVEAKKPVDWNEYRKVLEVARGIFTAEDERLIRQVRIDSRKSKYPEW